MSLVDHPRLPLIPWLASTQEDAHAMISFASRRTQRRTPHEMYELYTNFILHRRSFEWGVVQLMALMDSVIMNSYFRAGGYSTWEHELAMYVNGMFDTGSRSLPHVIQWLPRWAIAAVIRVTRTTPDWHKVPRLLYALEVELALRRHFEGRTLYLQTNAALGIERVFQKLDPGMNHRTLQTCIASFLSPSFTHRTPVVPRVPAAAAATNKRKLDDEDDDRRSKQCV